MNENVKEFIKHHGVKGMHWGVRKDRRLSRPESADSRRVSELRTRRPRQLTNRQLKLVNERLNLEQNFNRMNPSAIKRGTEAAAGILATVGVGVTAYNLVNGPAGKASVALGKKVLSKVKT